jgi:hypothetical protein
MKNINQMREIPDIPKIGMEFWIVDDGRSCAWKCKRISPRKFTCTYHIIDGNGFLRGTDMGESTDWIPIRMRKWYTYFTTPCPLGEA